MFKNFSGEIAGVFVVALTYFLPKFGVPVFDTLPALADEGLIFVSLLTVYVRRVMKGDVSLSGFRK